MSSIYEIKQSLLSLFEEIEENGGEITSEQENLLNIKQEELNIKLNNYHQAIASWNADINACKEEEKRIAAVRKKHENRIKRLKEAMCDAVLHFGNDSKSGNKVIELPTVRLYTKGTTKVEVDQERIDTLINAFISYITMLHQSGMLYTGQDVDLNIMKTNINDMVIREKGNDYPLFTISDLCTLKLDIISNMTIYDYLRKGGEILKSYLLEPTQFKIMDNTPKEEWKLAQQIGEKNEVSVPTCAHIEQNQSILFK